MDQETIRVEFGHRSLGDHRHGGEPVPQRFGIEKRQRGIGLKPGKLQHFLLAQLAVAADADVLDAEAEAARQHVGHGALLGARIRS